MQFFVCINVHDVHESIRLLSIKAISNRLPHMQLRLKSSLNEVSL